MTMRGTLPLLLAFGRGVLACLPLSCASADDGPHAVILLYHHVSEDTPRSTSVTPAVFESHLDYLTRQGYAVVALEDVVAALESGAALPAGAVALTFDDAYVSIYEEALPRLERRGWPFTVFVATDGVDDGYAGLMTWDQLRELESRGATIANHTTDHSHLVRREPGESESAWRRRTREKIERAQARLESELERPLKMLAYPYGEFDAPLEALARELGYAAFGQQSGPVGPDSPMHELPRFPVATGFDDIDSLAEKLRTRALPVTVLEPESRVLAARAGAPVLRLEVPEGAYRRDALLCYVAGQPPALIEWRGDVATIRARQALGAGRSKYNCTAPSIDTSGVFYWYSHLWIKPRKDGSWYPD